MPEPSPDQRLAALATRQRGVVSREQILALGFSERTIESRSRRGLWHRVAPSVYAIGHRGLSRRARGIAALLQAGPTAALSHWSAARVWRMTENAGEGEIHISVMDRRKRAVPEPIVLHRPRNLTPDSITLHRHLRTTTPERTLTDLLPRLTAATTTRMLEQMVTRLNRSPDDLHAWAASLAAVPNKGTLLRALDEVVGPVVLRSALETEFRSLCQDFRMPLPQTNAMIGRWEYDAVWFEHNVALELDSWTFHGGRWQFHQDRRKGLDANRAGFELVRMSWPQVKYERSSAAEAIALALARGSRNTRSGLILP